MLEKPTLTPHQEAFVRGNYNRMTVDEMGKALGLSRSKVAENMQAMGLKRDLHKPRKLAGYTTREGFFDADMYAKLNFI